MHQKLLKYLFSVIMASMFAVAARADYSNTVMSLSPVAYWPLNETVQPPAPYLATNSGTLGAAGDGYYETWFNPTNDGYEAQMNWTGPVSGATSDGDLAAEFGDVNRYIEIPHTFPGTVIKAPFTVECWVYPTNSANEWANLVGAGGQNGRSFNSSGSWAGFSLDEYVGKWIFDLYNTNGNNNSIELSSPATDNQWTHLVATFDGTNAILYVNGAEIAVETPSTNAVGLRYVPDSVNPIVMGMLNNPGYGSGYSFHGSLDEVAIYTNVLSPTEVSDHYNAATAGGYYTSVITNNPLIYLRLDEPLYNLPASNTFTSFPAAVNLGSIGNAANGYYQPGTLPGMPGPAGGGFGADNYSVAINGINAAVDVGNGVLNSVAPELNVTNTQPMSVVAWFKGNPADCYNRFQGLVGNGDNGWRFGFGSDGPHFNPGGGGEIVGGDSYNDGRWHMAAGIYSGSTNYLYIDGKLVASTAYSGSQSGSTRDVLLGGAPDYTTPAGRYWDGSLAQVAFYTNALSSTNVLQLYADAGIYPYILKQPVSATVNAKTAFTNTVVVDGSPSLQYQWYLNSSPVDGQTNAALILNPVEGADAGNYFVITSNNWGAVTSLVVSLAVNTAPHVDQEPLTNYVIFTGGSATLSLAASGAQPIYYYWNSNGVSSSASTDPDYTLTNITDNGTFYCIVSNFVGSVTSSVVSVSVISPPTEAYPQSVLADNPIGYWRLDEPNDGSVTYNAGVVAHDYWGGHNGVYTNTELEQTGYPSTPADPDTAALFGDIALSDSDAGQISGVDFGTANGGNAEFSVEAWVLAGAVQTSDAGIVTKGTGAGGEQFNLDTGGSGHAFRFFVRDAGGGVHIASSSVVPDSSSWHHVVGVCDESGGSVKLYVDGLLVASTTISPASGILASDNPLSIGARQSGASGSYDNQFYGTIDDVAVYDYALSQDQVDTHYYSTGVDPVPIIGQDIQNLSVTNYAGVSYTFSIQAAGAPPLHYQWVQDSTDVPDATNNSYTFMTLAGVHTYFCTVTNDYGSTNSLTATVTGIDIAALTNFTVNLSDYNNYANYYYDGSQYDPYVGPGAYPDATANDFWNGFGGSGPSIPYPSNGKLSDVSGVTTPLSYEISYNGGDNGAIYNYADGSNPNSLQGTPAYLLGNAALAGGSSTGTLILHNVPSGSYDLYLYGANYDGTRGALFTVNNGAATNGISATVNPYTSGGSGPLTTFVLGQDYVLFNGVTPDDSGNITIVWSQNVNDNSGGGEGDFNGMSLVRTGAAPTQMAAQMSAGNLIISWNPTNGVLQSATNVAGPYIDMTGVTTPYTNTFSKKQEFFRVKVSQP